MADVRFVVVRLTWRWTPAGFVRLPGETRVASFDTPEQAAADRRRRKEQARRVVNPFAAGPCPFEQTSLPAPVFRDWLLDHGVEPPDAFDRSAAWGPWWDGLPADQRAAVWDGLDKCRFFEAREVAAKPVAYVVVEVAWNYHDYEYAASGEGGVAVTAYRSRKKAEAECRRRNRAARRDFSDMTDEDPDDPNSGLMDHTARERLLADPFTDPGPEPTEDDWKFTADVPFVEVVEVELEDGA